MTREVIVGLMLRKTMRQIFDFYNVRYIESKTFVDSKFTFECDTETAIKIRDEIMRHV